MRGPGGAESAGDRVRHLKLESYRARARAILYYRDGADEYNGDHEDPALEARAREVVTQEGYAKVLREYDEIVEQWLEHGDPNDVLGELITAADRIDAARDEAELWREWLRKVAL